MFLAQGFDAASMNDIARKAGVSKGTLYVYFKSKEELFEAITERGGRLQAERVFVLDPADATSRRCCTRLGSAFAHFLCNRSTSPIRTVIAIADRMPEIGRQFYEPVRRSASPSCRPICRRRSRPACSISTPEDCDIVAGQFLESCLAGTFKPVLFNFAPPPPQERIDHVVGIAVRAFMKAYGTYS